MGYICKSCDVICIIFLIPGIDCPRGSRPGPAGSTIPAEPFGEEATVYTKEMCLQREVSFFYSLYIRDNNDMHVLPVW
jgi:hypothetical protein